jgi:uncharacterized Zn-finger protein
MRRNALPLAPSEDARQEDVVKCPYCKTDMRAGDIEVRSSWASFLFWGLSYQNLVFKAGDKPRVILESREKRAAHFCPSCKASLIAGDPSRKGETADPWGDDAGR